MRNFLTRLIRDNMNRFFSILFTQLFASLVTLGILLFLIFVVIAVGIGLMQKPSVKIKENSVLVIDLGRGIVDSPVERNLEDYIRFFQASHESSISLFEILEAIDRASQDTRIKGILIKGNAGSSKYNAGIATFHEVKRALKIFKTKGKPIVAFLNQAQVKDIFIGSVADTVVVDPFGEIWFQGLATESLYFGEAFKEYGIGVQVTQAGKYKTAIEPFTRRNMSEEDKEQLTLLLSDLWGQILREVAESRNINEATLDRYSKQKALFLPSEAKNAGFVDAIDYYDNVLSYLEQNKELGSQDLYNKVPLTDYIKEGRLKKSLKIKASKPKIAVLYAEGEIVYGTSYPNQVSAEKLVKKIKQIRDDDDFKALVLRVNSPGGSGAASEKIQRALMLAKDKKPVIISMGSYAASGGYWISCYGNYIFADPMSITGSIGVFGLAFNFEKIANSYNLYFDGIKTGPFAGINSYGVPKSSEEMKALNKFTQFYYDAFVNKVAQGRNQTVEQVQSIAQGRVWSGKEALKKGLVDKLGGLQDAIKQAGEVANITDWEIVQVPEPSGFASNIFEALFEDEVYVKPKKAPINLAITRIKTYFYSFLDDPKGIYARLPFSVNLL